MLMVNAKGVLLWVAAGMAIFSWLTAIPVQGATEQEKADAESCVKPAGGPVQKASVPQSSTASEKVPALPVARVGKSAPDFEATAFQNGGFRNLKLSDYRGKWVVLCFYPGDFTFV